MKPLRLFLLFFFKYLFSSRAGSLTRWVSLIFVLGFIVSLASLIIVICVMSGFGVSIKERLLSREPHLVVEGVKNQKSKVNLLKSVKQTLNSSELLSGIESIRLFETQDLIARSAEGVVVGVEGRGYRSKELPLILDHFTKNYLDEINPGVGIEVLEKTGANNSKNNQTVYINFNLSHQLSVFEGDFIFLMPAESLLMPATEISPPEKVYIGSFLDSSQTSQTVQRLFYEIGSILSLKETSSLSYGVEIFLKDPEAFAVYKKKLKDHQFKVQSWSDRNASLFFALKLEKTLMAVFLFLAVLISSFSISSMIRLLLAQKKKDIGILIVMGWSIHKIRKLFLGISLTLSLLGTLGGAFLAFLVCLFLKYNSIPFFPDVYYNRSIPVEIDFSVFVGVSFLGLVLAYTASWFPIYFYTLFSSMDLIRKS